MTHKLCHRRSEHESGNKGDTTLNPVFTGVIDSVKKCAYQYNTQSISIIVIEVVGFAITAFDEVLVSTTDRVSEPSVMPSVCN